VRLELDARRHHNVVVDGTGWPRFNYEVDYDTMAVTIAHDVVS
jgi:hypothetical protein